MVHQFFEIVVERAGAEFVLALRLAGDFLHDAVAVEIFGCEREQDVELGWGEREESVESSVSWSESDISESEYGCQDPMRAVRTAVGVERLGVWERSGAAPVHDLGWA